MNFFFVLLLSILITHINSIGLFTNFGQDSSKQSADGCLGCTIIIGSIQQYAEKHSEEPVKKILYDICKIIPESEKWMKWRKLCFEFVDEFGSLIEYMLEEEISPDKVCRKIIFCQGWEKCTLYKNREKGMMIDDKVRISDWKVMEMEKYKKKLYEEIMKSYNHGEKNEDILPPPFSDNDGDYFGTSFYQRGTSWRGKDCDDKDNNIYPRNPVDDNSDYNCNGIHGQMNGDSYEKLLCSETERRGVIALGDSACAHFRIPEQFFTQNLTLDMLENIFPLIENEADWPHLGLIAGYLNDTTGLSPGAVDSMYTYIKNRNLCNHRDYQTICVNGAASDNIHKYAWSLHRNPLDDHPVASFLMMIGNDVCSSHEGFEHMTKPREFHDNIVNLLKFLDTKYPPNSHVVLVGLADGSFLWKYLYDQTHPIGVTYEDVYTYMNCLENTPCWGYMSSNETVRKKTVQWANTLSEEYVKIKNEYKFENFKVHFLNFTDIQYKILKIWEDKGLNPKNLIEPFDGFHPSQLAIPYFREVSTQALIAEDPEIFGDINPNNEKIKELFGNQGGY